MNIVITGANRGIGLELTKIYSQEHQVYAICRNSDDELKKLGNTHIISNIDVTSSDSIQKLKQELKNKSIDILISNAGVLHQENLGDINFENIEEQFAVNSLGALRVIEALVPNLVEGSKIGIVSSRMGSIADNTSGGYYGYRASKAAVNAIGMSLAIDLANNNIAVALLHPGYVKTRMTGFAGYIGPEEAAKGIHNVMQNLTLEKTGMFWHSDGSTLPW